MNKQFQLFNDIAKNLMSVNAIELSQMFGKSCLKVGGKAFACFFHDEAVFKLKLDGPDHGKALVQKGAQLFDPSGKNRPMKEWVQIPFEHSKDWERFAVLAMEYMENRKI